MVKDLLFQGINFILLI